MTSSHGNPQNKMAVVTSNLGTCWMVAVSKKERSRWPPMAPTEPPSLSCRLRTAAELTVHHQLDHVEIDFMDIFIQSVRYCDFRVCKFFLQLFWETLTSLAQLKTNAICPDICGGLGQVSESGEHLGKLDFQHLWFWRILAWEPGQHLGKRRRGWSSSWSRWKMWMMSSCFYVQGAIGAWQEGVRVDTQARWEQTQLWYGAQIWEAEKIDQTEKLEKFYSSNRLLSDQGGKKTLTRVEKELWPGWKNITTDCTLTRVENHERLLQLQHEIRREFELIKMVGRIYLSLIWKT